MYGEFFLFLLEIQYKVCKRATFQDWSAIKYTNPQKRKNMAQNKYAIARYHMIDRLLHRNEYVKTMYIVEICRTKLRCKVTQRTIQMDIDAMRNDSFLGYYAPIEYDSKRKAYYYKDAAYRLFPMHFSADEFLLMQNLLQVVEDRILQEEYALLKNIIDKVKILSF